MLRRDRQVRMQIHQLMDACLFAIAFWLAYELRANAFITQLLGLPPFEVPFDSVAWLLVLLIPAAPLVLEAQGFYTRPAIGSRWTTVWQLFKGCAFTACGLILLLFCFKMLVIYFARWVVVWFGGLSFVLIFIKEEILRMIARSEIAQAQYHRRFLLVGTGDETSHLRAEAAAHPMENVQIVAELDLNKTSIEQLVQALHERSANGVILSAKHSYFEQVEAAIHACELEGVEAWLVADFFRTQISRTSLDEFYGRPIMVFRTVPDASWQSVLKPILDLIGALALLLLISVPLAIVALLIKVTSPGPILFRQLRSGLNGRPFTIYKFRTMVTDAEQRQHELAAMNEMRGPVFKMTGDPRVTSIGKFLRRYSIDEFPQLFNVLRGEMSLVGPRPLPVDEVKRFNDVAHRRRLSVKPGLTCLWQISGRNNVSDFQDWVRLDLEYIDNWSLWLDLKILVRTLPAVLAAQGAK